MGNVQFSTLIVNCALVFLLTILTACKSEKQTQQGGRGGQAVVVEAVVAKLTELKNSVRGVGILLPSKEVDVQAEMAGRIQAVYFNDGQNVKAGQLLVKIDDANLKAAVARANAKLLMLRATAQRKKQQFNAGAISAQEWEIAYADLQIAEADSIDATANYLKTLIRTPFEGRLGISSINIGKRLAVGDQIVKIVQKYPLKVDFSVADKYAAILKPGMEVQFSRNGINYNAIIDALESSLDGSTRTLRARAIVNEDPEELVPGAPLEFVLELPPRQSLTVPPEAIGSDALGSTAYLYKGGKAELVRIELGTRFVDRVEVLNGIASGDTVLCTGASPVRHGGNVEISRIK